MSVFFQRPLSSSCLLLKSSGRVSAYSAYRNFSAHKVISKNFNTPSSEVTQEALTGEKIQKPRRNILEQTKIQDFLDHVASTRDSVTLEDIERCKPKGHAPPGTPEYEKAYNALLDTLVRSFSKQQLLLFSDLYHLDYPVKRTKWHYAAGIIERQWKWPSLTDIQKKQRDWSEVDVRSFPLSPSQAFLILGKDGANLLTLSSKYNVHVSFSTHPLALKVEGLRGSLDNLGRYIAKFIDEVHIETFKLPSKKSPSLNLMQRISRLTGVLTESLGEGIIRQSYLKTEDQAAYTAKRLALRAGLEHSPLPLLVHASGYTPKPQAAFTTSPTTYAFYPFISSRPLPWTTMAGSLFRIRRVGHSLGVNSYETHEAPSGTNGIALGIDGEQISIKDHLLHELSQSSSDKSTSDTNIVASFGHLLVGDPTTEKKTITPPLGGHWELSRLSEWLQSSEMETTFLPSLPGPLVGSLSMKPQLLHRLVYQRLDKPGSPTGSSASFFKSELSFETSPNNREIFKQDPQAHADEDSPPIFAESDERNAGLTETSSDIAAPQCWIEVETGVDLILPDCSMDIRFSAVRSKSLSRDSWPGVLKRYLHEFGTFSSTSSRGGTPPHAPSSFTYEDVTYALVSVRTIRQSSEPIPSLKGSDLQLPPAISERTFESDSKDKFTTCKIICTDVSSQSAWESFLRSCDQLATPSRSTSNTTSMD